MSLNCPLKVTVKTVIKLFFICSSKGVCVCVGGGVVEESLCFQEKTIIFSLFSRVCYDFLVIKFITKPYLDSKFKEFTSTKITKMLGK